MPWEGQGAPRSPRGQEETPGKLEPVTDVAIGRGVRQHTGPHGAQQIPPHRSVSPRGKLESWGCLRPQGWGGGCGRTEATCCSDSRKLAVSVGPEPEARGQREPHTVRSHKTPVPAACGNRPGIVETRVYAAWPWAGWPRQADGLEAGREEGRPGHRRGARLCCRKGLGRQNDCGGHHVADGDAQQGLLHATQGGRAPRRLVRGTAREDRG